MAQDVRAMLFDFDGTIVDTYELILCSFHHAVRDVLGKDFPDEVLMRKVGQPLATQMWDFTDDEAVHEELCRSYRAHNALVHDGMIALFPDVESTLRALRDLGIACGIVTSKRHEAASQGLRRFGLEDAFSILVGSDDFPAHKPDPGPVTFAARSLGFAPEQCVYVGDSPFDMQAGLAAGCRTVGVSWGMFPVQTLLEQGAEEIADSFPGLLDIGPLCR